MVDTQAVEAYLAGVESAIDSRVDARVEQRLQGWRGAAVGRATSFTGRAVGSLAERLAAVERERDALKEELERSRSRVRLLEESHAKVRDRIAWALDSLHNILEGKGWTWDWPRAPPHTPPSS